MRVLIIPTWYPLGGDKLMGIYHREFAESLCENGVDANILFIDRQRITRPISYLFMKKWNVLKENNFNTYVQKMLDVSKISENLEIKHYIKALDKAFNKYLKINPKPDVINAMVTYPAGYAACVLGKKYGIPVVVTEHGGALERFFVRDDLKEYGKYVLENSVYSTVSNYMRDIVLKYGKECCIIPNVVKTDVFKNSTKRKIKGIFKLVSVCALREGKRLDIAFNAVKILKESGFNVHLDIIGDGYYESEFKKCAEGIGVSDNVSFLGRMNKEEISKIFENEHALLISSELESFAIPGLEAMASGLPVVSTKCLGPEEYMDDKTGVMCEVNSAESMAQAIRKLHNNYDSYDTKYLNSVADKYSSSHVAKMAIDVYKRSMKK